MSLFFAGSGAVLQQRAKGELSAEAVPERCGSKDWRVQFTHRAVGSELGPSAQVGWPKPTQGSHATNYRTQPGEHHHLCRVSKHLLRRHYNGDRISRRQHYLPQSEVSWISDNHALLAIIQSVQTHQHNQLKQQLN